MHCARCRAFFQILMRQLLKPIYAGADQELQDIMLHAGDDLRTTLMEVHCAFVPTGLGCYKGAGVHYYSNYLRLSCISQTIV